VALALLVVPRLFEAPTEGTQRLKEAIPDAPVAASLDLQFTVESSLGGTPALTDGAEDGRYGRDESFIFGARADSPGTLTLLETGPDGQSRIVAPVDGAGWQLGESGVLTLSDDAGQRLAYQPDGAAGTYRYTALLTDAEAPAPGAADAARLARGETVSGTTLLASDTFAVEWGVGE